MAQSKSSAFRDEVNLMGGPRSATHYEFLDGKKYIELKDGEQGVVLNKEEAEHLVMFLKNIGWV